MNTLTTTICNECGYEHEERMCVCTWVSDKICGIHKLSSIDDFDDNTIDPILKFINKSRNNRNILFLGPSGTGKSHCATSLAKYIANKERTNDILSIKSLSRLPSTYEKEIVEYQKPKILVINEFSNDMFMLLDNRIESDRELYTICTSNMTIDQIEPRFLWRFKIFTFGGESLKADDISELYDIKLEKYNKWLEYQENSTFGKVDLEDIFNNDGLESTKITGFTGMCEDTTQYYNETIL